MVCRPRQRVVRDRHQERLVLLDDAHVRVDGVEAADHGEDLLLLREVAARRDLVIAYVPEVGAELVRVSAAAVTEIIGPFRCRFLEHEAGLV